ncbi:MAG: hypothetical protein PHX10_08580, partial [Gallionellaceae bacterium]|nr:hypothetical protein [Gallionellaceae bacterium]
IYIDAGTMVRTLSPTPGIFLEPVRYAKLWVRQQVHNGIQVGGRLAYEAVLHELCTLKGNVEDKLDHLSRLPAELRDQAAYDFFSAFFDHYLPKKFLRNYIWGHGNPIKLSLQEMKDCNPVINLNKSGPFTRRLEKLRNEAAATRKSVAYPFTLEMVAGAATNGTLGQFTVRFAGKLVVEPDGGWAADGTMDFSDTWDFDPKDPDKGGRSGQGEAKTRIGNTFLPGTPFQITSETTAFRQTQDDDLVVWAGGRPNAELDKVSKADVAITQPDR